MDAIEKSGAQSLSTKQKGKCPFCLESVEATVQESNYLRRDRCICPKCSEPVYVCRTPGCHHYAKGTSTYDHEFCPECTSSGAAVATEVGKGLLKVGVAALTVVAVTAVKEKK